MVKRALVSAIAGVLWLTAMPVAAQVGPGGVVGGARPATRPGVVLGGATRPNLSPADIPPAVPIASAKTLPPPAPDPIERPEFNDKVKPIAKNITSATAMMIIDGPDGELGVTADVIATVVAGSRERDPFAEILQSITAFSADSEVLKKHPEIKGFAEMLKGKSDDTRATEIKSVASALLSDPTFVQSHQSVAKFFRDKLTEVSQPQAVIIKKQAAVGPEMTTSFDEAVRAIGMRYPQWGPGRLEFSFGDKYTPHEGGSAGTCFGVMLLSEIEGFEIDPKCAVTGDITVDWKVRKIGGLAAKVRGATADKCLYAGVPLENRDQISDMALFYGDASLRDIQVFSLATLQDAAALMRKDRSPQLVEAMKEFADLKPRLTGGRTTFNTPAITKVLDNIVALAPNHESAKMMLEMAHGTFPRTLSLGFALEQLGLVLQRYRVVLSGAVPPTRQLIPATLTQASRKSLSQISQMCPPELAPLVTDLRGIVDVSDNIAAGYSPPAALRARRDAFVADLQKLDSNRDFVEKLIRSGI